jgi:LPXTG-motif cell wall-anchored protein
VGTAPTVETQPGTVGMPRTGAGADVIPGALLALALASVAGGAVLRRRAALRG